MKSVIKKRLVALLAGTSALALGGALLCMQAPVAHAAEEAGTCVAFYNVGANDDADAIDAALGLEEKGVSPTTEGAVTTGGTLFTSYAVNPTYEVTLGTGSYRVAVIVKTGATVTIDNAEAKISGTGENVIATATVEGKSSVTVAVEGKVCAVAADDATGAASLIAAEYTEGQVISYGKLLSEELEGATGYFTDGSIQKVEIEYGNINAATGVNVNFTTIDVTGTVKGTQLGVTRHITTMPDDLIYFINGGSHDYDNGRWEKSSDPYYAYNQMIFDYYKNGSGALKNDGISDREAPSKSEWGWYGDKQSAVTHTATSISFPYSSVRCMDRDDAATLGYYLTGLEQRAYRIWIGTQSPWHGRTVNITFNGKAIAGAETLKINAAKGYTIFENIMPDSSGKIDINMKGASTNEPCVAFIAVQTMDTALEEKPKKLDGPTTVGMDDNSITVSNVVKGAKLQIHNANKPNQMLYEVIAPSSGTYTLNWKDAYTVIGPDGQAKETKLSQLGISRFNVVQLTNGGVSDNLVVSITDVEIADDGDVSMLEASLAKNVFTTDSVTVTVKAKANSGIVSWAWRLGEAGNLHSTSLDHVYQFEDSFVAEENGIYTVIVTSGLGVTREESIAIGNIDRDKPIINITPSTETWGKDDKYTVTVGVVSVAPIVEYKLIKNGDVKESQKYTIDEEGKGGLTSRTVTVDGEGEYTVYVRSASGMTNTRSFQAVKENANPTVVKATRVKGNGNVRFTFSAANGYELSEKEGVVVYLVTESGTEDVLVGQSGKNYTFSISKEGNYIAIVTTATGETEVIAFEVTKAEVSRTSINIGKSGGGADSQLGIGVGVMVGGIVIAAAAIVVMLVLLKKKKAATPAEQPAESDDSNPQQ